MDSSTAPSGASSVTAYLVFLIFVTTLGPLQFGYHLSELNAPQAVITCEKRSLDVRSQAAATFPQCIPMTPAQFGLVSSSYTLGGLVGALLAGPFSTRYGRLLALRATTAFFVLGPLLETTATSIPHLSAGRLLSGVGAGAAIVVGPIYIAETAPRGARGFFGAFTQVMTNVGILLAQSLGYFLSKGNAWRVILAIAGLIGVLQLVGLLFVPESPVWLAEHHQRVGRAKRILQRIRGRGADIHAEIKDWNVSPNNSNNSNNNDDNDVDDDAAASMTEEEEESLLSPPPPGNSNPPAKRRPPVSILGAVSDPLYRPAIIAVVAVMVAQQFTGINSIIMYSVSLLSTILPTTASLLAVIVSAINVVTTLICAPLADKIGRKSCLLLSIAGMGLNSVLLAVSIASGLSILSAVATLLFVASFAVGLGPVPFILASELVGPEAVGATQSWALAANWIATFIVAQFFPLLNEALGPGQIYWIFAAMALVFGGFLAWWVPESRGKRTADEVWGRPERRVD